MEDVLTEQKKDMSAMPEFDEFEDEILRPLSRQGIKFLNPLIEEPNADQLLLTNRDMDNLARGIIRLRSAAAPQHQKHDYTEIIKRYLESDEGSASIRDELLPSLSVASVQGILRRIQASCQRALSEKVSIDTLIGVGEPEESSFTIRDARLLSGVAFQAMGVERAVTLPSALVQRTSDEYDPDDPMAWRKDALCAQIGTALFFPENGESARDAKEACKACEVRTLCGEYAVRYDEHFGIWGGLSERERQKLRSRRRT